VFWSSSKAVTLSVTPSAPNARARIANKTATIPQPRVPASRKDTVKGRRFFADKYDVGSQLNFEKFLIENQVLTVEMLKAAVVDAHTRKITLPQALVEKGIVSEEILAQTLAKYHNVPFHPGPLVFSSELLTQFPAFTIRRYKIIPLEKSDTHITVATANPGNFLATDEIRRLTRLDVKVVCTTDRTIQEALGRIAQETTGIGSSLPKPSPGGENTEAKVVLSDNEVNSSTATHIDQILQRSISRAASDIHFEPQTNYALVRERIDGLLYEVERMPIDQFAPILSRLKLQGGMDIVEKRLAQDGRFKYISGNFNCEMRGSTLPTIYGEKLVLRLLRADKSDPTLETVDIGAVRTKMIEKICENPDGLILVAGPTGCGKTTTIYAILNRLDRRSHNLIMVEDPVEYEMEYANQVQINAKIGVTFSSILPFILRQDPDLLMVGEIRDEATTQMVMRAAISGHLVFSTIHAPNALQTVARLLDMGVEPHMVVASLRSCISQRLLRRLCTNCRQPREASVEDKRLLGQPLDKPLKIFVEGSCEQCHHLGYSGRFAVMEVLMIDERLREAILKNDQKLLEAIALEIGFKTMRDHAAERIIAGETTIREMVANCS